MRISLYPFMLCIIEKFIPLSHIIAVDINFIICRIGILIYSYVLKTLLFEIISSKFLEKVRLKAKYIKNIGFFLSAESELNVKKNIKVNNGNI
ncbi:hypothetical protein F0310_00900 [Borrelia sp. A-FGy1]|nr:hypothetical protein F0310_00900 [Borrelia sp. A-FGy1]